MKKVLLALALVLGAVTAASASEVLNGCYKKNNGQFRVVVPPKTCLPSEKAVSLLSAAAVGTANPLVYDANDQFLGVGQADDLYIPSLRKWATINLRDVSGASGPASSITRAPTAADSRTPSTSTCTGFSATVNRRADGTTPRRRSSRGTSSSAAWPMARATARRSISSMRW